MSEAQAFRYLATHVLGVEPRHVPRDLRARVNQHACICQAVELLMLRDRAPRIDSETRYAMLRRVDAYMAPDMAYAYETDEYEDNDESAEARMARAMACLWLAEEAADA